MQFYNRAIWSPVWKARTSLSKIQVFSLGFSPYRVFIDHWKREIVFFWGIEVVTEVGSGKHSLPVRRLGEHRTSSFTWGMLGLGAMPRSYRCSFLNESVIIWPLYRTLLVRALKSLTIYQVFTNRTCQKSDSSGAETGTCTLFDINTYLKNHQNIKCAGLKGKSKTCGNSFEFPD